MTIIGSAPFAWAKRLAAVCLVFDVIVLSLIAGIWLERRHEKSPMQRLERVTVELIELRESMK